MAKRWWENDPVVESSDWWENDPVVDTPATDQPGGWDFLSQYGQAPEQPAVEEPPSRELLDYGKSALSGVVRFPESIVGLVDLFNTPHRAVFEKVTGKDAKTVTEILADIGVDFAGARGILAESKSEGSKAEREAVNEAFADDGIFGGLKSLGSNPQVIAETVVESVPEMLSLAGLVRVAAVNVFSKATAAATAAGATREAAAIAGRQAVEQAAPRLATLSAVLEGAQSAGNQAAEYAAEGRLKERQALASLAGGAGVAAVGFGLNRVAPRLGLEDVETALATGGLRGGRGGIIDRARGAVSGAARGALREGPLEEGAQSYLEQIAQNFGDERPLFEGTGQAAVEGMLAGTVLGAGGGGFAGARPDRAEQLARQLDQDIDATNWAPGSDTRVAADMLSPDRGVAPQAPAPTAPPAVEPAPVSAAPVQPEATVPPSVTTTWVGDDGIPHPVQVVQADVPVEGDPRPYSLVSYAGTEILVPSDQLQSAPRREISFTPDDSPTAQAGLQPIIVPEVTPNVSGTAAPIPVPAGSSGLGGADAVGSLGVAGRNDVGGRRLVDTGAEPGAAGAGVVPGGSGATQPTPSVVEWTGRNGNGYATLEDAMRGMNRRQQLAPGYDWRVEPAGNRFKLVGERIEQTPVQTETEAAITAGPTEVGQAETLRDMGDLESAATRRATAQATLDRLADQGHIEQISLGEPDPVLAQQVQDLGDTLTRAFGSDARVVPFASDDASAPQGMQLGNLLLIDTVAPQNPVANTTLHEFKHSIEAIAAADTRAGRKNTPARRFTEQIHSLFDDMSDEGKRSYLENFLRRDELRGITDATAREARIQELLGSDELRSEMTADFMGNRANDREWLADLARTDPEGFRGFVQKWIDLLDNLVKSLRGIKNQSRMESARVDQYVKDLNRAKMVARDALVEFRKSTAKPTGAREGAAAGTTTGRPGARPRSSVKDAWLNRRAGQPRFSTRQPMDGRAFTGFFSNITAGLTGRPGDRAFTPTLNVDGISEFVREYERHRGNFDDHIGTSIPTFRELQTIVGDAIVKSFDNADMLDIGASEGALVKTISKLSDGNIRTVALDPNPSMAAHFNSGERVPGSKYAADAFGTREEEGGDAWVEDDVLVDRDGSTRPNPYAGRQIRFYKPDRKFDVVHEAMVFQFINSDRSQQVGRIKELMKPGGIVILEEKFIPGPGLPKSQFDANEAQKDVFKEQYFTQEQIEEKARAVGVKDQEAYREAQAEQESQIVGMADLMVAPAQLEKVLGDNFQHVVQFWDAGNFKGYMASDSRANLENLLGNMVDVNSEFSTTQTPRWVGDSAPLMSRRQGATPAETTRRSDRNEQAAGLQPPRGDIYRNIEVRPGTTAEQKRLGRSAVRDFFNWLQRAAVRAGESPRSVSLLGASMYRGFVEGAPQSLIGSTISSSADLAALAQVYRDPRFETLRAFFVDADGNVILEQAASTRNPASVNFGDEFLPDLTNAFRNSGAEKFYLLHNHPSGSPAPSENDLRFTQRIADELGDAFASHVVIDHNSYAVIDRNGDYKVIDAPELVGIDFSARPEAEHELLGTSVKSPKDIGMIGKRVAQADDPVLVVTKGGVYAEVGLITSVPMSFLELSTGTAAERARFLAGLRRMIRVAGVGGRAFVVLPKSADSRQNYGWMHEAFAQDVINSDGLSVLNPSSIRNKSVDDVTGVTMRGGRVTTRTAQLREDAAAPSPTEADARAVGRSDELTFSRRQNLTENFLPNRPGSPGNEDVRGYGAPAPTTVAGIGPARKYPMTDEFRQTVTDSGLTPVDMVELPMTQSAATRFEQAVQDSKAASRYGAAVYVYPVNEYQGMRLFQSEDGRSGFAIKPDGDIVSVYSDGGGKAHSMLALAVEQGGAKLDAFDTVLPELYSINGFREVRREPWNDRFRPEGWDKNTFADFNNGEPDVVFMEYDPTYIPDLGVTEQQETTRGDREGRVASRELAPLEGAPAVRGAAGPDPEIVRVAETYAREAGIPYTRQTEYVDVDESRARRLADAYDRMEHAPNDPVVREAYENLIRQTTAQYRALEDAGYRFYFYDETNDPYDGNPWNAMRDLRDNKVMGVFATEAGFGSGATELDVGDNPLLADTGIEWSWGDLGGQPKRVLANDLFRAVHDAFGHGLEGAGFRARGEENAWQAHARLFTGSALAALTSETRGQNSWLNYGPYGEQNRNAKVEDTVFADQKTGLMPEWTWTEGLVDGVEQSPLRQAADRVVVDPIQRAAVESVLGGRVAEMSDTRLRDAVSRAAQDPAQRRVIAQTEAGRQLLDAAISTEPEQVPMFSARQPLGFYRELDNRVTQGPGSAMKDQWKGYINGLKQKGVKPDEIEWSGVLDWLDMQEGKVSREQVQQFLDGNGVQLEEVVQESASVPDTTKYASYTVPGDTSNYREVLLTLPEKKSAPVDSGKSAATMLFERDMLDKYGGESFPSVYGRLNGSEIDRYEMLVREDRNAAKSESLLQERLNNYKSSHWDQPNVIAHVRTTDRVDADGNRVLFVEEVQSDWAQDGRKKGFKQPPVVRQIGPDRFVVETPDGKRLELTDGTVAFATKESAQWAIDDGRFDRAIGASGIPRAPFVTSTDKWVSLAIKRILTMATEGGYDKVAFVNGEQAAEMFDLSNQISEVNYNPDDEWLMAYDHNGGRVFDEEVSPEDLDDYVGKELADRIRGDAESNRTAQEYERGEWSTELDEDPDTGEEFYILIDSNGEPLYSNFGDLERFDTEADAREWIDENVATDMDDVNLSGLDLKVGGEGMKGFYDNILPKVLRDVLKKIDKSQPETVRLESPKGRPTQYADFQTWLSTPDIVESEQVGFTITDTMREKVETTGLPMFSQRQQDMFSDDMIGPETEGNQNNLGRPIAPTRQALENFERWFGDSELVDDRGRPQVFYHTTASDFSEFESGRVTQNAGTFATWDTTRAAIFFTGSIEDSQAYGNKEGYPDHMGPWDRGANVMPVYLKADNVLDLTQGLSESDWNNVEGHGLNPSYINHAGWDMFDGEEGVETVAGLRAAGYDAVKFWDENPETGDNFEAVAVFDPNQIKSATGNRGTFDPTTADIRFSQRQTDTPEFKRWFGDSKVVDAQGNPLVMYHGSSADISEFITTGGRGKTYGTGAFFTSSPDTANTYVVGGEGGNVTPVYVSLENPVVVDGGGAHWNRLGADVRVSLPTITVSDLANERLAAELEGREVDWDASVTREARSASLSELFPDELQYDDDAFSTDDLARWARSQGYDGVVFQNVVDRGPSGRFADSEAASSPSTLAVAFRPEQIKSATGNVGTFDPSNPDITMSRRQNALGQVGPHIDWTVGDTGLLDNFIYLLQDKHVDLKRVQQAITEGGKQIEDQWDAYLKEGLYHGRAADQTLRFMRDEIRPLMVEIKARGESIESLEEYLHNAHAISRNAQIRKINPDMQDAGSGITDEAAQTYLDNLPADRRNRLEALAKRIRDIVHETQDVLVAGGLETQETIDTWRKVYPDYVPLEREDLDFGMGNALIPGSGQGYSVRGSSSRRATGSERPVRNILANIALQRENAITRAEKNRVATALYGLAVQNPNTKFWLPVNPDMKFTSRGRASLAAELTGMGLNPLDARGVIEEPKQQYIDPITGLVTQRVNPALRNSDNVIALRINGQDRYLFLNNRDPRAQRMAVALKNLDPSQMNLALRTSASITRWLASVNTQYNPVFGVFNFIRDVRASGLNLTTTELAGKQVQLMAAVPGALGAIYNDLRKDRGMKSRPGSEWNRLWREFSEVGAKTGYREQFRTSDERHNALFREMNNLHGSIPRRLFNAVFGWLSDYNEAGENAVRLAAYKVALDNGISKERAAMLAKDLTVNFNRKGHVTQQMSALYAFFNSSVQGNERTFRTLRGPAGTKIIAGGLLLGVLQALGLAMAGFGEDEPPEFIRERNNVIPIPGGDPNDYITIPMPLGFHIIPNTSRLLTEGWLRGWADKGDTAMDLIGSVLDAFNPIGHAGWSWQTVFPTAADPLIALLENRDWSGRPIYRESFSGRDVSPGTDRAMSTATWWSKELAKYLNLASGGTEFTAGKLSPTPDQIDYLIGQATGGVGRETSKAAQLVESAITGESLPPYKVPLAGRFYGTTSGPAGPSSAFYSNLERMARHRAEIDGRVEQRRATGEYFNQHPEARLAKEAVVAENEVRKARRRMREAIERGDRERVREIEERIANVMTRFNEKVDARNEERSERRRMIRDAVSR